MNVIASPITTIFRYSNGKIINRNNEIKITGRTTKNHIRRIGFLKLISNSSIITPPSRYCITTLYYNKITSQNNY